MLNRAPPPKIHDLKKLAIKGGIFEDLSKNQALLLKELQPLQIEARYPEYKEKVSKLLDFDKTQNILNQTEEFLCWIKKKLEK